MGDVQTLPLQLVPASTAILLMDLQVAVAQLDTAPRSVDEVVEAGKRLAMAGRSSGAKVFLVRSGGEPDGLDWPNAESDQPMPRGVRPQGWDKLLPGIGPEPGDILITKRQWGSFYGTDLDLQLSRRGIDTLVLAGVASNFVVESTAREAWERGYRLYFAEDAMAARSAEDHAFAIARIFPRIGRVVTVDQIVQLLANAS